MPRKRSREATESHLITATAKLLAECGFKALGVNAVARQADVDKVLIYRYFGGLHQLIEAVASSADFWPSIDELLPPTQLSSITTEDQSKALKTLLRNYTTAIRSRPLTQEILAWEVIERNELTIPFEDVRERTGLEIAARLSELNMGTEDIASLLAILSAAIHYLVLRGRKIRRFVGVPIDSDEGWERIYTTIDLMIDAQFSASE